jgi:hypothetical protein
MHCTVLLLLLLLVVVVVVVLLLLLLQVLSPSLTLKQTALEFARISTAMHDAYIACWQVSSARHLHATNLPGTDLCAKTVSPTHDTILSS